MDTIESIIMEMIDIYRTGEYAVNTIYNLYPNSFFDGVKCASMEGFLESLKYFNIKNQSRMCCLIGKEVKIRWQQKVYMEADW